MTQSSGRVAVSYPDLERSGSSGQLLPGTQARIVDPASGADVARGAQGELWFRGPQAFKGHLNQPQVQVAYVVARGALEPEDVRSWLAERVVAYKQAGGVILCDAMPKSAAGKILRRVLRVHDASGRASV